MKFAIRPILWLMIGKEGACNFWPLRIAGKGDEDIWLVVFTSNGYCIPKVSVYHGLPMKDGGRMTFLPDLLSSGMFAVAKCTQITTRMISGQEDTCESADGIGPGQFSCYQ